MDWPLSDPIAEPSSVSRQVESLLTAARRAQAKWRDLGLARRLAILGAVRRRLAREGERLARSIALPQRPDWSQSLAAEVIPLADACRYLERNAGKLLRDRALSRRDRPMWLGRVDGWVQRDPFGVVLIIAPGNYPLMIAGVQLLQALAAGNGALVKPAPGSETCLELLAALLQEAGAPRELVGLLPSTPAAAQAAMDLGVDKVFFTGSARVGRDIQKRLAETGTPSVMELSGSDALIVLEGADRELVGKAIAFGLRFNGGQTCIAPRRIFVPQRELIAWRSMLATQLNEMRPLPVPTAAAERLKRLSEAATAAGAAVFPSNCAGACGMEAPQAAAEGVMVRPLLITGAAPESDLLAEDWFAPATFLFGYSDAQTVAQEAGKSPYALGASVFGPLPQATEVARQLDVGTATINDLIAPTADPRAAFGGRRASGFGFTRGDEGLLEMTQAKYLLRRRDRWRPHLEPAELADAALLKHYLLAAHGGTWSDWGRGMWNFLAASLGRNFKRGQGS